MPMPQPNPGESRQDFVSRFMADKVMVEDYKDQKQRLAVAYSQFRTNKSLGKELPSHQKQFMAKILDSTPESDTFTGIATAEIVDTEGDIVEVDGIDLSLHTPDSPIKICPAHMRKFEDGKPAVVGVVTKLWKGFTVFQGDRVKCLFFEARWADTELAKEWKKLYDDGILDAFSLGAVPIDGYKINTGVRYTASKLAEISTVVVGANPAAIRILRKSLGKIYNNSISEEIMSQINKGLEIQSTAVAKPNQTAVADPVDKNLESGTGPSMSNAVSGTDTGANTIHKGVEDMMTMCMKTMGDNHVALCKALDDHMEGIHSRLDGLESAMTTFLDESAPVTSAPSVDKGLKIKKELAAKNAQLGELRDLLSAVREKISPAAK